MNARIVDRKVSALNKTELPNNGAFGSVEDTQNVPSRRGTHATTLKSEATYQEIDTICHQSTAGDDSQDIRPCLRIDQLRGCESVGEYSKQYTCTKHYGEFGAGQRSQQISG